MFFRPYIDWEQTVAVFHLLKQHFFASVGSYTDQEKNYSFFMGKICIYSLEKTLNILYFQKILFKNLQKKCLVNTNVFVYLFIFGNVFIFF